MGLRLCAVVVTALTLTACGAITSPAPAARNVEAVLRTQPRSTLQIVYAFPNVAAGRYPTSPVLAANGVFYGTNYVPPSHDDHFYELTPGSSGYTETILYQFGPGASLGERPTVLHRDAAGNLWGASSTGIFRFHDNGSTWIGTLEYKVRGSNPLGQGVAAIGHSVYFVDHQTSVLYRLTPSGSRYAASVVYAFPGSSNPASLIAIDSAGAIYGTTMAGGASGAGTVFRLTPAGNGTYTETDLHVFSGTSGPSADGFAANNGVVRDASGALYGVTEGGGKLGHGTVFKLTPGASGYSYAIVDDVANGFQPHGPPALDGNGNVYFTTACTTGVGKGGGTILKLSPSGGGY